MASHEVRISCSLEALLPALADLGPSVEISALQVPNQAALDQMLDRLRRSGLTIVEMRELPTRPTGPTVELPDAASAVVPTSAQPLIESPGPETDTIERLGKLARLHKSGALTYEEIHAAKADVLGI